MKAGTSSFLAPLSLTAIASLTLTSTYQWLDETLWPTLTHEQQQVHATIFITFTCCVAVIFFMRYLKAASVLASIVEHSGDGIIAKDATGNIISWNTGAERIYGYTFEEVRGKPISVLLPPGAEDEMPRLLERINNGEHIDHFETVRVRKDGAKIHVSLNVSPIRNALGIIIGVSTIVRDITEQKRIEEKLRESENHLRHVLDNTVAMIGILSPAGILLEANRTALEAASLSSEDVLGKPFEECYWWAWSPQVQERLRAAIIRASRGERLRYDETIRIGAGDFITIDFMLSPIYGADGRITHIIPSALDITGRKKLEQELLKAKDDLELRVQARTNALRRNEEKYRELVENANSIILKTDMDGNITFFNEFAQDFFGYSEEEVYGKSVLGTIIPETDSFGHDLTCMIADMKRNPDLYVHNEHENMRKDGERVWVAWRNRVITDGAGQLSGVLAVGTDMTAMKRAENEREIYASRLEESHRELQAQTKGLEEANAALRVLLKQRDKDRKELEETVLLNIKNLVMPYMEKIKKTGLSGEQIPYFDMIESHLKQVTSQFMRTVSQVSQGLTPTEIQVVNLIREGKTSKEIAS